MIQVEIEQVPFLHGRIFLSTLYIEEASTARKERTATMTQDRATMENTVKKRRKWKVRVTSRSWFPS